MTTYGYISKKMEDLSKLIETAVNENSRMAQDQSDYMERYNGYVSRYNAAKAEYDRLTEELSDKQRRYKAMKRFLKHLTDNPQPISEFDDCLWLTIVDTVTVRSDGTLIFRFFDGVEIEE